MSAPASTTRRFRGYIGAARRGKSRAAWHDAVRDGRESGAPVLWIGTVTPKPQDCDVDGERVHFERFPTIDAWHARGCPPFAVIPPSFDAMAYAWDQSNALGAVVLDEITEHLIDRGDTAGSIDLFLDVIARKHRHGAVQDEDTACSWSITTGTTVGMPTGTFSIVQTYVSWWRVGCIASRTDLQVVDPFTNFPRGGDNWPERYAGKKYEEIARDPALCHCALLLDKWGGEVFFERCECFNSQRSETQNNPQQPEEQP